MMSHTYLRCLNDGLLFAHFPCFSSDFLDVFNCFDDSEILRVERFIIFFRLNIINIICSCDGDTESFQFTVVVETVLTVFGSTVDLTHLLQQFYLLFGTLFHHSVGN